MNTKKIEELMSRFDVTFKEQEQQERVELLKTLAELVEKHGYDSVSFTTGYKVSTITVILRGHIQNISKQRIERAVYVYNNLTSE